MKKLKVGIVGCGRISAVYRSAFHRHSDLAALCYAVDKQPERAQRFAGEFGCGWSQNFEDLLQQDLDVVHICTPHFLHAQQVNACLEAGFNVLTEKPMGIAMEQARSMTQTADRTGKTLGVILQNRYIEGIVEAKRAIEAGELGRLQGAWSLLAWHRPPSYYECDWKGSWQKEGGGVLIDQAIHSIDLVQYLVGSDVKYIQGHIENRILKTVEVEDVADAVVLFENGCRYSLFACNYYTANAPVQLEIMGDKGKLSLKGFDVTIETEKGVRRIEAPKISDPIVGGQTYWGVYHSQEIRAYYEAILAGKKFWLDGREGSRALQIVLGVYESSQKKQPILF